MKYFYVAVYVLLFAVLMFAEYPIHQADQQVIITLFQETGVPNIVSGILLRNRLFDTVGEVMVFTISVMIVNTLLSQDTPVVERHYVHDSITLLLFGLGSTIAALICMELALRGHLSPGGGFSAGIAGGTAMGLVAISAGPEKLQAIFDERHLKTWEKVSVLLLIGCSALTLLNVSLLELFTGAEVSSLMIPVLNVLITIKVAIGSWAIILAFIRYRGLF